MHRSHPAVATNASATDTSATDTLPDSAAYAFSNPSPDSAHECHSSPPEAPDEFDDNDVLLRFARCRGLGSSPAAVSCASLALADASILLYDMVAACSCAG